MNDRQHSWTHGYRADVEYTAGFYGILNPDHLLLKTVLFGVQPPADVVAPAPGGRRLNYCELGSGQGITLNYMAARDPDGAYFGVDHNPVHVANARAFAEAAGTVNATFIEEGFTGLADLDLPEFDVIVLHGIYSWIAADVRGHVIAFLRKKLKPGGVVYNSYNCAVGRLGDKPYRQLMIDVERSLQGGAGQRIEEVLDIVEAVATAGAGYFKANPSALERLKNLRQHAPAYVIHEYLNDHWEPFFFHQVASEMDRAKLTFIGSARLALARADLCLPAEAHEHLARFQDQWAREQFKDIWHNQTFRQDLFAKGVARLTPVQQVERLRPLRFALARPRDACALHVPVPAGQATLPEEPYAKLLDALAGGTKTGGDLRAYLDRKPVGNAMLVDALQVLIAVGHVMPVIAADNEGAVRAGVERFNAAIARDVDKGAEVYLIGSPLSGTAHQLSLIDYELARAHGDGAGNVPKAALQRLKERGRSLIRDGERIDDDAQALALLEQLDETFTKTLLPQLRLGGAL